MKKEKKIPKEFIAIAKHHASKRTAMNEKVRNSNQSYHSYTPELSDLLGVLGEQLSALEMMKAGKAFFLNALFSQSQVFAPDLIVKDDGKVYNIDVKATRNDKFCLPVYKLEKAKKVGISHFWVFRIHLDELKYETKFFPLDAVNEWQQEELFDKMQYTKKLF